MSHISPDRRAELVRYFVYAAHPTVAEARRRWGHASQTLRAIRNSVTRRKCTHTSKPQHPDPTPAEIVAACAAIRAGWTDAEYYWRALGRMRGDTSERVFSVQQYCTEVHGRKRHIFFKAV